jgi:hypothetical protein
MKQMFTRLLSWIVVFSLLCPGVLQAQTWRPLPPIPANFSYDTTRGAPMLAVGPTGIPYALYLDFGPSGGPGNVFVLKYVDSAWTPVGNQSFAGARLGGSDIHVTTNNSVYAGLNDFGALPELYVNNGASWSQVGVPPSSPVNSTTVPPSLAIDRNGTPWYAIYNARTGSPSVFTYSGGTWVETGVGQLGNGGGGQVVQLVFDYHNTPYIAYDETNPGSPVPYLVVEKYSGGGWNKIGTTTLYSSGANHILAFDDQNTPYVINNIGDPTHGYTFELMKFTGADWAPDGPVVTADTPNSYPAQVSVYNITQIYLAMGQHNTPLIGYYETVIPYPVAFVKLDSSAWVPAADTTIIVEAASSNAIAFTADTLGHAFLAYTGISDQSILVWQFVQTNPKAMITFSDVVGTFGSPDFSPGATSTNTDPGDPITYSILDTTVATIVNGKVHIVKAGSTYITASQAADANWSAADPVQVRLTIFTDSQNITFPGWPQKKVGDPDFAAGGSASSGLPVTYEGSDPTIATVSPDGTIHIIEQGAIIVTAHQPGDSNYLAAPDVAQVLIITDSTTADSTGGSPGRGKGKIIAYCNSRSSLLVQVIPPVDGPALLEVYNSFGWRVYSREIDPSVKGGNTFLVPVGQLPGGIYYVRVKGNGYNLIQAIWIK